MGKLSGPLLRTLFVDFLRSCHASEVSFRRVLRARRTLLRFLCPSFSPRLAAALQLGRQKAKDEVAKKDYELSVLEDEVSSRNEKIDILSKSLERCRNGRQVLSGEEAPERGTQLLFKR